jgi:magnesium-transporting ATPase (P-type)
MLHTSQYYHWPVNDRTINMFKEFYYWMYWYSRKIRTDSDKEKARNAYLLIGIFQAMNIGTLFIVVKYFHKILLTRNESIYAGILMMTVIGAVNHFYLFSNREKIFQTFEHNSPGRRRKGKLLFLLYVAGSSFLLFYVGSILLPYE